LPQAQTRCSALRAARQWLPACDERQTRPSETHRARARHRSGVEAWDIVAHATATVTLVLHAAFQRRGTNTARLPPTAPPVALSDDVLSSAGRCVSGSSIAIDVEPPPSRLSAFHTP